MALKSIDEAYDKVLGGYADWLAAQYEGEGEDYDFMPELEQYSFVRAVVPTSWHTIIIVRADYGDDGGPAELIAFIDPLTSEVATVVQSFDTTQVLIYDREREEVN